MNLILIAPPAAGKGTLASMISTKYGNICISAGELLRGVNPDTELGKHIRQLQSERLLITDDIMNALMKERLMKDDVKNGFILDGYPRRMAQVEAIEKICEELNLKIDYAVLLNVEYDTALKRTLGRQICPECKRTYNYLTGVNAPKVKDMCDDCKTQLSTRNDDNEETLKKGFEIYNNNALEVIEYYKKKGMLIEVNANNDALSTFNELVSKINS